ncbi:MAG: VacB/RNase II family 3'-5' exoribonuclease, partial [Gammaproteobacteria bacterium]|nr:VacB/RNase II family 3'-5' exoribonuclease [Gammaproteobacteria bacterium]
AGAGDYLLCKLTRHPFADGKGQAKILEILGKPSTPGIEHKITCLKHDLPRHWPKEVQQLTDTLAHTPPTGLTGDQQRRDLLDLPFVTIDSASTLDMDDALHAAETESGWRLTVAVADPSASIAANSPIDRAARERANTAYLPGGALTMLPEALSHDTFSLLAEVPRPVLLCHMDVSHSGAIEHYQFEFGLIKSRHKLSYQQVAAYLDQQQNEACPPDCQPLLQCLAACSSALNGFRRQHMLLMEERDDYDIVVDADLHIAEILRQSRNSAQQIVEEAMLATNRSAGELFAKHPNSGIFSTHAGFRPEKLAAIKTTLEADYPELASIDPSQLDGYLELIRALQARPDAATLLAAFRLMLQAGQLSLEPRPHLGLGMHHYATVTSPIRRYNDLHNHRAIRAILAGTKPPALTAEDLVDMQSRIGSTRMASRDLEQWLYCLFMKQHQDKALAGHIFRVTSQGVMVKLDDWGITGFVKLDPKQHKFDELRMTMTRESITYTLNQPVTVKLESIDLDKKRLSFCWAENTVTASAPIESTSTDSTETNSTETDNPKAAS